MEEKPKTMREALERLADSARTLTFARDLADVIEIFVILGRDTDSRSLDVDVTGLR